MTLVKPGDHLRSRVCTTEVIVVKAPSIDVTIACGSELAFLQAVLPTARVERVTHILAGGHACAYQVRPGNAA